MCLKMYSIGAFQIVRQNINFLQSIRTKIVHPYKLESSNQKRAYKTDEIIL
jgi:hypothetical protein